MDLSTERIPAKNVGRKMGVAKFGINFGSNVHNCRRLST